MKEEVRNTNYRAGGLIVVLIVVLCIFNFSLIKHQLNAWKLLPQPEKLTELYFNNSSNLPTTYVPGQIQRISFTTHNLEYEPFVYRYSIVEQDQNGTVIQKLQNGTFSLNQNQYNTTVSNLNLVDGGNRVKVVINLDNINQSINYWVNKAGS